MSLSVPLLYKYVCLPLRVSIVLPCLYLNFSDPLPSVVTAYSHPSLPLSLSLSPPPLLSNSNSLSLSLTYSLSLPPTLGSLSTCSALFVFSAIVLSPPGPGFVESAFLYPLDLAGLEHMQSAFSLYYRYGMTSQCEYKSTVWVSWLALERWL